MRVLFNLIGNLFKKIANVEVRGESVKILTGALIGLYNTDDVVEINNIGLSRMDKHNMYTLKIVEIGQTDRLPQNLAQYLVSVLQKYKNTQLSRFGVTNFDALKNDILTQINSNYSSGVKEIKFLSIDKYKNIVLSITGLSKEEIKKLDSDAMQIALNNGFTYNGKPAAFMVMNSQNKASGIFTFKSSFLSNFIPTLQSFGYDTSVLNQVIQPTAQNQDQQQNKQNPNDQGIKMSINLDPKSNMYHICFNGFPSPHIIEIIKREQGRRYFAETKCWGVTRSSINETFIGNLKSLCDKANIKYDSDALSSLVSSLSSINESDEKDSKTTFKINFEDVSDSKSPWMLEITNMPSKIEKVITLTDEKHNNERNEIINAVKMCFPKAYLSQQEIEYRKRANTKVIGNHSIEDAGRNGFSTLMKGVYEDFVFLGKILNGMGFDVSSLKTSFVSLVSKNKISKPKSVLGQVGDYPSKEEFTKALDAKTRDKTPDGKPLSLYPKQKDDIKFLYERNSAILGADTGTGKTAMALMAAAMRMSSASDRCLIITLKSTAYQWKKEIKTFSYTKDDEISMKDPNKGRWVILTYPQFSGRTISVPAANTTENKDIKKESQIEQDGAKELLNVLNSGLSEEEINKKISELISSGKVSMNILQKIIESQKNAQNKIPMERVEDPKTLKLIEDINNSNFKCLILDESHSIKNDSKRTEKISKISEKIPFKWGATATFIANYPEDAYYQLRILGNRIANVTKSDFISMFSGKVLKFIPAIKATVWAYPDDPEEKKKRIKIATDKLIGILKSTESYQSRTKKDIRPDMPDLTVEDNYVQVEQSKLAALSERINNKLSKYKDPELAISQLIAERLEIANEKVDMSIDMARSLMQQGKKVAIFSCFVEPGKKLVSGLNSIIAEEELDGKVGSIISDTPDKEVERLRNTFNDPKEKYIAYVISSSKGGTGISFPDGADVVIFNDFDWTPSIITQAMGRFYRINNSKNVSTIFMVADGTPDTVTYDKVQFKIQIAEKINKIQLLLDKAISEEEKAKLIEEKDKLEKLEI